MRTLYCLMVCVLALGSHAQSGLFVNEFLASNNNTMSDITGEYEDWFELFNSSSNSVNLQGYYLSDDTSNLTKFEISNPLSISAGGFLLIWASGDSSRGANHVDFKLSASQGEAVIITAPDGITVLDSVVFGPQTTDISKGRTTDGASSWSFFTTPTPDASNNTSTPFSAVLKKPDFSQAGGFYNSPFSLAINPQDTGVTIYYTLDGSRPDPSNINGKTFTYKNQFRQFPSSPTNFPFLNDSIETHVYNDSLSINNRTPQPNRTSAKSTQFLQTPFFIPDTVVQKGTVVRAMAQRAGAVSSPIETHTYFVGSDLVNRYTFPVISLSIDEDMLFDYNNGYFTAGAVFENWRAVNNGVARGNTPANWQWAGRTFERPMSFEYFNTSGQKEFGQDVGARIHGGWSRARKRKSFRLYARNDYGENTFNFPFFTNRPHNVYKRILIRNSGNDEERAGFRDAAIHNLVNHLEFDIQKSEPVIVFLNGDYWGFYNIREWQNRFYIERMYGLESDEIDFLTPFRVANDGNAAHFTSMVNFANQQNLADDSLFGELERQMVVEDFTDYIIAEVYARNTDWPVNNIKWWRKRVPYDSTAPRGHDGRWRWLMYDVDFGYGMSGGNSSYTHNTLVHARNNGDVGILLRSMWPNITYRHYFINRYADLMNSCFLPAHTIGVFDSVKQLYVPEIAEHIERWSSHTNIQAWNDSIDIMMTFAEERPAFARMHLMSQFNLPAAHKVTLDVSDTLAGHVRVNTITILDTTVGVPNSPYPWEGLYFQTVPIELEAYANTGYQFLHWEIGNQTITSPTITVNLNSDSSVLAVFATDSLIVCGPSAHALENCAYTFTEWSNNAAPGSTPDNIHFVYFDEDDPSDTAVIAGQTNGAFNHTSQTRIVGLDNNGIGFINTGNPQGNTGYPGTRLGGMVLNLNTENLNRAFVQWVGGTLEPNSRIYHIKLQYRLGTNGTWADLLDDDGNAVEYTRQANFNHSEIIGPVDLPTILMGRECVQLMWRYYYTGQRQSASSGARDLLRIDDIIVAKGDAPNDPVSVDDPNTNIDILGERVVLRSSSENYLVTHQSGLTYNWSVINGTIVSGQGTSSIFVQWNNSGAGSVTLQTIDNNNCQSERRISVNISDLSVDKHNLSAVDVYPNPSNGQFVIERRSFAQEELKLRIINGAGQVVHLERLKPSETNALSIKLPSGNYHIQISDKSHSIIYNGKITIIGN